MSWVWMAVLYYPWLVARTGDSNYRKWCFSRFYCQCRVSYFCYLVGSQQPPHSGVRLLCKTRRWGASEATAPKRFCEENKLNFVVMQRIQKLRKQLTKLVKMRLHSTAGPLKTVGINYSLSPPNRLQENALSQVCVLLFFQIEFNIFWKN